MEISVPGCEQTAPPTFDPFAVLLLVLALGADMSCT
jgi:hypothetical protein